MEVYMKKSLITCFIFLIISFFIISCNNNPDINLPTETTLSTENPTNFAVYIVKKSNKSFVHMQ